RKILPLKSETVRLTVTVPPQFSAQSFNILKSAGDFKGEEWLSDGSLRVIVEMNAGMKAQFLDRLGSVSKGSAVVKEG
ncbi:MAG: SBDS family ribosome assembly factor, partial [Nitrososphaera sp.]